MTTGEIAIYLAGATFALSVIDKALGYIRGKVEGSAGEAEKKAATMALVVDHDKWIRSSIAHGEPAVVAQRILSAENAIAALEAEDRRQAVELGKHDTKLGEHERRLGAISSSRHPAQR